MKITSLPLLLFLVPSLAQAELAFEPIYSSHMVLQREVPLPVYGTATPDGEVTVAFAGQTKTARAGADGKWKALLDPLSAGGPHVLSAKSGSEETKLDDILVGDVWVASGQSNMAWQTRQSTNAEEELRASQPPLLRGCLIPYKAVAAQPLEYVEAKWCRSDQPDEMQWLSGQGYFFARDLAEKLKIPIGLISVAKGGTPAESFMRSELLAANPDFRPILERMEKSDRDYPALKAEFDAGAAQRDAEYAKVVAEAKAAGKKPLPPKRLVPPDYHSRPCGLWNSMIHPIIKLPIKGVVWNQGVSNAKYSEVYAELFQALIKDWREQWKCGDFPFIFVQIERNNNYKSLTEAPPVAGDEEWAEIREAQARSLATPRTWMVPAFDQGEDGTDRHPRDKKTPGLRLANMALRHVYGQQNVVADAPRFKAAKAVEGGIEIEFANTADGLKVKGEKILGFAVGDENRKWAWTEAEITGKNTVLVRFPAEIPKAMYVRYNWAQYCMGNLYGSTDLPAEPFRTDAWPYLTAGKR